MIWRDSEHIQAELEKTFRLIEDTRMRGLPLLNPALEVQTTVFKRCTAGDWAGVLITPWSMNLILLPGDENGWAGTPSGGELERNFPSGDYRFTAARDDDLGPYALCSLFSPMFEFSDQATALAAAQGAFEGLWTPPARSISRRDLLRGALNKGKPI
jgi:[NiFe] hydrogenase assembly HybE family chaperone